MTGPARLNHPLCCTQCNQGAADYTYRDQANITKYVCTQCLWNWNCIARCCENCRREIFDNKHSFVRINQGREEESAAASKVKRQAIIGRFEAPALSQHQSPFPAAGAAAAAPAAAAAAAAAAMENPAEINGLPNQSLIFDLSAMRETFEKFKLAWSLLLQSHPSLKSLHVRFDEKNNAIYFTSIGIDEMELLFSNFKEINSFIIRDRDGLMFNSRYFNPNRMQGKILNLDESVEDLIHISKRALDNSPRLEPKKLSRASQPRQWMEETLRDNEGLIIGEVHHDPAPKKFLIEQMKRLKEMGVKTLFLEHLFYDTMQEKLDRLPQEKDELLDAYLHHLDKHFIHPFSPLRLNAWNFSSLVEAARKEGIRVVGIDTSISYNAGSQREEYLDAGANGPDRIYSMNYTAKQIIEKNKGNGKWVVLCGSAHASLLGHSNDNEQLKFIPGLRQLLGQPAMIISSGEKASSFELHPKPEEENFGSRLCLYDFDAHLTMMSEGAQGAAAGPPAAMPAAAGAAAAGPYAAIRAAAAGPFVPMPAAAGAAAAGPFVPMPAAAGAAGAVAPPKTRWEVLEERTQAETAEIRNLSQDANVCRHRFNNVPCPMYTAVPYPGERGRFLHANFVRSDQRTFVASQAPLPEDQEAFWRVIFDNGATIFDLSTIEDQKKGVTKYYPDHMSQEINYGSISVKVVGISVNERTFSLQLTDTRTGQIKTIKRYHYEAWDDFRSVALPELTTLIDRVEALSPNPKELLWIHCRAGLGRTGTLITALTLKEQIKSGAINRENLEDSLMKILIDLRKQRGAGFVQTHEQFNLLVEYGASLLKK